MKKTIRFIVLVPLAIFLVYCCYHFITNDMHPKYTDCGIIISKSNDEVAIKYGTKTELYLNVQFDNAGFRSVNCNPTTYFKYNKDERVCFELDKEVPEWYDTINMIGVFTLVIIALILIIIFIVYLIPDSWKQNL